VRGALRILRLLDGYCGHEGLRVAPGRLLQGTFSQTTGAAGLSRDVLAQNPSKETLCKEEGCDILCDDCVSFRIGMTVDPRVGVSMY
jgi:hypothetical protein